ncbi:biotin transporter BioY [Staphylococcus lutrae]|uniref:Biotin transporter n=1 Tax=Staphylococcus lutrae TaxID=155085 RepID=A0AAC9RN36_9STAP|nr:biotin transporter BioY [Staphylococcus lutrae]ARJ50438.1 biotin transporter BioY [Staphylococcus lutrae]PNZ38784.1 biotin transporter BioY [Staphylococcus lutrae]
MNTKFLVYTALMSAVIAIMGFIPAIPLPFMPVPIVIQNAGIFLAGLLLGRRYGTLSVIVFLLVVLVGAPLLSGGRGGYAVFVGPSAGFLLMYPIVAFLIGWMRDKYFETLDFKRTFAILLVFGVVLLDLVGAIVMGFVTHIPVSKALYFSLTFLPGDIIKAVLASLIAMALFRNPIISRVMRQLSQ